MNVMFEINREVDYGLLVLGALASRHQMDSEQYVSLRDLSDERRLPYRFVSRIVAPLKNAGLVESQEGIYGGYRLSRPPGDIGIRDVLSALGEDMMLVRCEMGHQFCQSFSECNSRGFWHQLQLRIDAFINDCTLADLIRPSRAGLKPNVLFDRISRSLSHRSVPVVNRSRFH